MSRAIALFCALCALFCAWCSIRLVEGSQAGWATNGQIKDAMREQVALVQLVRKEVETVRQLNAQQIAVVHVALGRLEAQENQYLRAAYPYTARWIAQEEKMLALERGLMEFKRRLSP